MRTKIARSRAASIAAAVLCAWGMVIPVVAVAAEAVPAAVEAAAAETSTPLPGGAEAAAGAAEGIAKEGVTPAMQHFQQGLELYYRNQFREALEQFNRCLNLDPNYQQALTMREKCEAKLQMVVVGQDPAAAPKFETVEPSQLGPASTTTGDLGAEELKYQRVRELMEQAQTYLEGRKFRRAAELYSQVLLIAPDNKRALRGHQDAMIGISEENIQDAQKTVDIERQRTREYIEGAKTLPEGADARGIKPFRLTIPVVNEQVEEKKSESQIERALNTLVTLEYEDGVHIQKILDYVSEYFEVNIMVDKRVVRPPQQPQAAQTFQAGSVPGAPGSPGMPGGAPVGAVPTPAPAGPGSLSALAQTGGGVQPLSGGGQGPNALQTEYVTDGLLSKLYLTNVELREALHAMLRGLNLDYSVQRSFIWISTPERIRTETFEPLETKYFTLKNAGSETMFKVVVTNVGGSGGTTTGGGTGGNIGGGGGNIGGGGGNIGGGGGAIGGGSTATSGFGNISDLFNTFDDQSVGEPPAVIGLSGGGTGYGGNQQYGGGGGNQYSGSGGGGGNRQYGTSGGGGGSRQSGTSGGGGGSRQTGGGGSNQYGGGQSNQYGGGQYGQSGGGGLVGILNLLRDPRIVPIVLDPYSGELLSYIDYNPLTNQLIVHNTKTNIEVLKQQLTEIDVTPHQVSIEAKFLTVNVTDLKKLGFNWQATQSDLGNRARTIEDVEGDTYSYDINGDGVAESIPFYTKPDGSSVINNTITRSIVDAVVSPGPVGAFKLSGIITDNADGDSLSLVMDYLDSLATTELLSSPRVTTMSGKPAVIADFTTQTFNTGVITSIQSNTGTLAGGVNTSFTQALTFETFIFGITFSVTPQVSGDQVRLWLNPQVTSRLTEDTFNQTSIINGSQVTNLIRFPRVSVQSVWTNVIVHDGDTLVLGGLVTDTSTKETQKLPYLADIPVLGSFFRGKSNRIGQSSLLIFVTVDIIDPTGAKFYESKS